MLRGHHGLVKGVAWDPVGRYIASQGDDRSLLVWRTTDWGQETAVTKPFLEVRETRAAVGTWDLTLQQVCRSPVLLYG